jgi:hypothetical protein
MVTGMYNDSINWTVNSEMRGRGESMKRWKERWKKMSTHTQMVE